MAGIVGARTSATEGWAGSNQGGRLVRKVADDIAIVSPKLTPFLKLIGINGEAIDNPRYEWYEDAYIAETIELNGAISATDTTTFNVTTGTGFNVQVGSIYSFTGTLSAVAGTEYVYVSAVATDALTVTRGVAGTSALDTIADNAIGQKVTIANTENTAPPTANTYSMDNLYNLVQIFEKKWQFSHMQANSNYYGGPDPDYQEAKKFEETLVELERSCIYGKRAAASSPVPQLMGGIDYYISTNATAVSASLEAYHINNLLQDIYNTVGPDKMGKTILCNADVKQQINELFAPFAQQPRKEKIGGVVIDILNTDFGDIEVLSMFRVPTSTLYVINRDMISIHPYKNSEFQIWEVPATTMSTTKAIYGAYTMRVGSEKAMGKLTGITLVNS